MSLCPSLFDFSHDSSGSSSEYHDNTIAAFGLLQHGLSQQQHLLRDCADYFRNIQQQVGDAFGYNNVVSQQQSRRLEQLESSLSGEVLSHALDYQASTNTALAATQSGVHLHLDKVSKSLHNQMASAKDFHQLKSALNLHIDQCQNTSIILPSNSNNVTIVLSFPKTAIRSQVFSVASDFIEAIRTLHEIAECMYHLDRIVARYAVMSCVGFFVLLILVVKGWSQCACNPVNYTLSHDKLWESVCYYKTNGTFPTFEYEGTWPCYTWIATARGENGEFTLHRTVLQHCENTKTLDSWQCTATVMVRDRYGDLQVVRPAAELIQQTSIDWCQDI